VADRLPLFLWHLGRRGGGPRYTLELAREFAGRDDIDLHLALSRQSELFDQTCALGTPVLPIDTYTGLAGFVAGLARVPSIARTLRSYVERHRLPVALCAMAHLWNAFLVPALKKGGVANCLVVHDVTPHAGDNYAIRHLMIRQDIRQADLLITLSSAVRNELIRRHHCHADQVELSCLGPFRYGGLPDRHDRRLGTPPYRLLFFGRLLPYKGLGQLIDAVRLLEQRGIPVKLRVIGNGTIGLTGLPASVEIDRRWVPEGEIPSIFGESDLVVLPYQEASQSGVIPIAQHLGVPVLVTPVGGLLEQVDYGRKGYVTEDSTAEALASAIQAALQDPQGYARMSASTLKDDSDRQWAAIADAIVANLRAAAARRRQESR
jgi:glycosyltransferase involved in cell wall biosynthesis